MPAPVPINNVTKVVVTLADGTKVLQTYRTVTTPQGVKQIQAGQPITAAQLSAQIAALSSDLALLDADPAGPQS